MFPLSVCCVCVCVRVCETHCRHKKRVKEIQQKLKEMEVAGNVSSPTPFLLHLFTDAHAILQSLQVYTYCMCISNELCTLLCSSV